MNRKLLASAMALMVTGAAHAQSSRTTTDLGMGGVASVGRYEPVQSSLTMYGIIDAGVTYINNFNGKSAMRLDSGINQSSRFGLKGTEDLGGGLKAVFNLESGFSMTDGTLASGRLFGRRAFAGLTDRKYGTILAGRGYDFLYDYVSYYTNVAQFAPSYAFHLANDIDRLAGEQVSNMVRYESPTFHGVQAGVLYGASNGNPAATPHVLSMGVKYNPTGTMNAPYTLAAAYTRTTGGGTTLARSGGTLAQMSSGAHSIYTAAIAGKVKLGNKVDLNGMFTYTSQSGITRHGPMVAPITQVYEIGVQYHPTWDWTLALGNAWIDQHQCGHYNQLSHGISYRFSKRTDVFLFGTWQRAFGAGNVAGMFLVTQPATMNQGLPNAIVGLSTTRNQVATQLGLRHVF